MNKIYKVIWSKTRNCYVAVSEIAKRNGKSCTSVNCGARSLRMSAVALGVTAALFAGSSCFGTPAAWAASSGNSVEVTTGNPDYVYGGYANSTAPPSGRIVGGYSTTVTDAADSNTVTIGGVNVNNRVFGGYSAGGNANLNNLTINSGATIGEQVFGGNSSDSGTGNANKNTVTINGGQFGAEVYGGYSLKGNAGENQVIINSGTMIDVYGGEAAGNATGNIVNISQSSTEVLTTINGTVYGGYSYSGNAGGTGKGEGNTVTISGGSVDSVFGGFSKSGAVSYNRIKIDGGTVTDADVSWIESPAGSGNWVGTPRLAGGFSEEGAVTGNQVSIANATIGGSYPTVYGGYSKTGNVSKNSVTINSNNANLYVYGGNSDSGTVGGDNVTDGNVVTIESGAVNFAAGGYSVGSISTAGGTVKHNKVTVLDGTIGGQVIGGFSSGANTELNKVIIEKGSVNEVLGGQSDGKDALNNAVTINSGTIKNVYGGKAVTYYITGKCGDAKGNEVTISQSEGKTIAVSGNIYGGHSASGNAGGATAEEGNKVTISGSATEITGEVYGGYVESGSGAASNNSVEITAGTVNSCVYGGYSNSGTVGGTAEGEGNTVTITGGSVDSVFGGFSKSGAVSYNRIKIDGGTVTNADVSWIESPAGSGNWVGMPRLAGGFSEEGAVTGNQVSIANATIGGSYPTVYGGYSKTGNVSKNSVTINSNNANLYVYGGNSDSGTVGGDNATDGNVVTIQSGAVIYVTGGSSVGGDVKNNKAVIEGGIVDSAVEGGNSVSGAVSGNVVTISGSSTKISGNGWQPGVYGGRNSSATKAVSDNHVIISDGATVNTFVYGGYSTLGNAENNEVTIKGGKVKQEVYGGRTGGSANGNTVTISDGAVVQSNIYGGYSSGDVYYSEGTPSTADDNTVNISGSPDLSESEICGGSAYTSAQNNTVNILSPITVKGLTGGIIQTSGTIAGNTLNVAAKNVTAGSVNGFQNMNFYLPSDIANNDTMLTVNGGSATDVQGVTFGAAALSGVNLQKGDTVNLLVNENGLKTDDSIKTTDSATLAKASFLSANSLTTDDEYELSISQKDANTIIATVGNVTEKKAPEEAVGDIKKSPVETRAGVVTLLNAGTDMLVSQGMANAADAAAAERSGGNAAAAPRAGGFAPFAAVGLGNLRAESGSHVNTKSIGLNLGFAREIENKSGKLLVGPVVEYGHGSYDSYQDNGITADGKSSYWGIGVIAKQTNNNGFYYEGSIRAGRTKSDYGSDNVKPGTHVSYDSSATYWALHLGAGKLVDIGHSNTLDYYGKYFYSHTGSDSAFLNGANETANFDAVNSHRIRLGARFIHAINEKNNIYGGLAWQYEFSGDARATYSVSGEAPSPSVKGSSGMIELGWQVKPGKSPMTIDLSVTGWVGKQRGITANVQANWTF